MPRIARVVAPGYPHHITQKGNYGQIVFEDDDDKVQYLRWIEEYSCKYGVTNLVFCLMTNHLHFVSIPKDTDSFARTFNTAHMRYSQYMNKKRNVRGHLWQGRFNSYIMDEPHLMMASCYIERNPVRAGMVNKPWQWKWSSAKSHTVEEDKDRNCVKLGNLFDYIDMDKRQWKEYIDKKEEEKEIKRIDDNLISGKPLAEEIFIKRLEKKLNRKLFTLPRGRPKKNK